MRITSNASDDEEDDLPINKKLNKNQKTKIVASLLSPKLDNNSLFAGGSLKRKSNNLSFLSNEIPAIKKRFLVELPSVSLTKLNNQERVEQATTKLINDKYIKEISNNENKDIQIVNNIKRLGSRKRKHQGAQFEISENSCENKINQDNKNRNSETTSEKKFRENINDVDGTLLELNNHTNKPLSLLSQKYEDKDKLEKSDYIPPIRKFFKTQNTNVKVETVFSGGKYLFNATRCAKQESKQKQQQQQQPNIAKFQLSLEPIFKKSTKKFLGKNQIKSKKSNSNNFAQNPPSVSSKRFAENKENFSISSKINKNLSENNQSLEQIENITIKTEDNYSKDIEVNNNEIIDLIKTDETQQTLHKNKEQQELKEEEEDEEQNETTASKLNKIKNFLNIPPGRKLFSDNTMSMYDRRIQADERPANGYTSNNSGSTVRGIHHHNEDSSSSNHSNSIMNNHYYQCTPPPPPPQPTMATLCNIGNTCYLNSVVYTLRFAPMFLHNLHHLIDDLTSIQQNFNKYHVKSSSLGRNISGLHMENTRSWSSKDLASLENMSCDMPKSNQQIATEKLHELYQSLHRNEYTENTEPFHADTFLHAIQDVSAIFEGNQQQDAHEFLMCVLDSIRETCQALIKAISECPDAIINGCISLPEQKESQCAVTIPKEKPLQRDTGSSAIIKTSFFSRKSKRKDAEMKTSKNTISNNSNSSRLQSPHKDNTHHQVSSSSDGSNAGGGVGGGSDTLNGSKHSLKGNLISDNDLTNIKDNKERLSDKIKRMGLDFFTEDFEGVTVSTTKCLSCETITEQKETMIDIAVPITGYENIELGERFIQDSCVTKEYFRGENKYRCEQCMGYTEAIRSISYEILPRLLVIQLSRFSGVMEKINTYLPTPFTLQCFCSKCLGPSSSSTTTSSENKNLHVYKLYSVITHVGATMSVGHYIAYTCSLDWANDYINCPKDRMRQAQMIKQQQQQQHGINVGGGSNTSNSILNGPEKNVRQIKKMIFGRSKASSSGDMSKTVKNLNGLPLLSKSTATTTTTQTNGGLDKQQNNTINTMNLTCPSINCCGLQLRNNHLLNNSNYNNSSSGSLMNSNSGGGGGYYMDVEDSHQTSSIYNSNIYNNTSGYGTNAQQNLCSSGNSGRNRSLQQNEPIWYMCDDDKIKAMSQREFEDMLSPNRKIMITPYLLFYARNDIQ